MKILIVDDEPMLLETFEHKLRKEGYTVFPATSAEDGMRLYKQTKPDLMILDVMLPNRSGFDLCRAVRKDSQTPIIFVTARGSELDKVAGLELGADDYLVKPVNLAELAARVKAVLRRSSRSDLAESVTSGNLRIDPKSHMALLGEKELNLAPQEFALLYFLVRNKGQAFTRETLIDRVWSEESYVSPRTVDVHIRWLREHIEVNPSAPTRIATIRGVGYKFIE